MSQLQRLSSLLQLCVKQQIHTPIKIWNVTTFSKSCHLKSCIYLGSSSMFRDAVPIQGSVSVRSFATRIDDKATELINKIKPLEQSKKQLGERKKILNFDYSGDLEKVKPPVKDEILFGFDELDVWKDEPEEVKRIFTLEFADGGQRMAHEIHKMEEKFSEVCGPFWNLEKIIAKDTVHVRHLIQHCMIKKKDKRARVILEEKIAKRKKKLKQLRKIDYERFVWLLKTLKIQYTASPLHPKKVSRAGRIKQAAREEAIAYKNMKLKELEEKVKEEYESFKIYRDKELADIDQVVQEYGLDMDRILKEIQPKETSKNR